MQITDKNDIKIFILYLLENIDYPLDFTTINDIVVQNDFVGYFDFAECFAELLDAGHIIEEKKDNVSTYKISAKGSHVARELQSNILTSIREKSLKSALKLLSFQKRGAKLICNSKQRQDGKYDLECVITEHDSETLHLTIVTDSAVRLQKMQQNFRERPEDMYRGIIALLAGEVDYLFG